jgi:hypothetical protein
MALGAFLSGLSSIAAAAQKKKAVPTINGVPVSSLTDLPAGSYDPNLLYQAYNSDLGYKYAGQDYGTNTGRINEDYGLSTGRLNQDYGLNTGRALSDYTLNNNRLNEDYGLNTGRLTDDYNQNTSRLGEDYNTSIGRSDQDYGIGQQRTNQKYDWQGQDLDTSHTRGLADLLTQYSQSNEDRQRAYGRLGNEQTQSAAARGLASGGALTQAMQKRAANQGFEQNRSDLAYNTATGRENEDYGTQSGRLGTMRTQDLSDLTLSHNRYNEDATRGYTRGTQDLNTGYSRGTQDLTLGYNRGTQDLSNSYNRYTEDQSLSRDRGLADLLLNKDRSLGDQLTSYSRAGDTNALYQGGLFNTAGAQVNQYAQQYGAPQGYVTYNGSVYKRTATGGLAPA